MIVLLNPARDAASRFFRAAIVCRPEVERGKLEAEPFENHMYFGS